MNQEQLHPLADRMFGDVTYFSGRIKRHQAERSGLQHRQQIRPVRPRPGQAVQLRVSSGPEHSVAQVRCFYTIDGREPTLDSPQLQLLPAPPEWDTVAWNYVHWWQGTLPPQPAGTLLRYRIGGRRTGQDDWIFADNQAATIDEATPFGLWFDPNPAPAWVETTIIYQIFLDRFYPGDGRDWQPVNGMADIYGGTLRGVIDKLDYIRDLGAGAIWLSPLFASDSHHRYDAWDYYQVEPSLGSNEDLHELIAAVHARGMRIILDFVANHWSHKHESFQAALKDKNSPYYDWYHWLEWPHDYHTFFGVREMPMLNLQSPGARSYLFDAAHYWLDQGVDGFRLDYVLGPSYEFWADFRRACREAQPGCWLFGEATDTGPAQLAFANAMDGTCDFLLTDALRKTFALGSWSLGRFDAFLQANEDFFPQHFVRPAFLDNHDMNRFLYVAGDDRDRLKLAALLLLTLPGPPIIYCGTEVGVSQARPIHQNDFGIFEEARQPMKWDDEQDKDLLHYFQRLIYLRQATPAILSDRRVTCHLDETSGTYAYLIRRGSDTAMLVALNCGAAAQTLTLPAAGLPADAVDRLNGHPVKIAGATLTVTLPAGQGAFIS